VMGDEGQRSAGASALRTPVGTQSMWVGGREN